MTEPLQVLAELVRSKSGIALPPNQFESLRASVARSADGADPDRFLLRVLDPARGPELLDRLIDEVTVNETSFFRDWGALETVSWHLLLERARDRGRHHVRVWCAACSTGEEAYSLAIAAHEAFGTAVPPVSILATDISARVLGRAWEGRYRERTMRAVTPRIRGRHFVDDGDTVEVGPSARRIVEYRQHNLALDPLPPLGELPFDLVVCRNVLIYFDSETVARVIDGLERAVGDGGTLILGAADTLCGTTRRLAQLAFDEGPPPQTRVRGRSARSARSRLRRPLGREAQAPTLEDAIRAAGEGRSDQALSATAQLVAANPLDAEVNFLHGLLQLDAGETAHAIEALRRALYIDPTFALASFQLGRAYDVLGDAPAARRSYAQALRGLDPEDERHEPLLGQVDLGDIAAAAAARLEALG